MYILKSQSDCAPAVLLIEFTGPISRVGSPCSGMGRSLKMMITGHWVRIPHGRESTCHEVQSKCGDLDRARVVSAEPRHFLGPITHKAPETQVANSPNS